MLICTLLSRRKCRNSLLSAALNHNRLKHDLRLNLLLSKKSWSTTWLDTCKGLAYNTRTGHSTCSITTHHIKNKVTRELHSSLGRLIRIMVLTGKYTIRCTTNPLEPIYLWSFHFRAQWFIVKALTNQEIWITLSQWRKCARHFISYLL
jgi:hypothetical protein